MKRYWLLKTEPDEYSIDDLQCDGTTCWDGVRNYQARNILRDQMKAGDGVLIYHSSTDPTGVVGQAEVIRGGYPDHTALDSRHRHHDPKSKADNPTWFMVDVKFVSKFKRLVPLPELKATRGLENMVVTKPSRLSVQPVTTLEYGIVEKLGTTIG